MKILMNLDFYLWNHFVPGISTDFFKRRYNSVLALLYVSLFKLPRKFLLNYLKGNGKAMVLDTQKLITRNYEVLNKWKHSVQLAMEERQKRGVLSVSQVDICNPNYKYSIGSFSVNYFIKDGIVVTNIQSVYRFQNNPDRITKHLHNWLFSLRNKGITNDFDIIGIEWKIGLNELNSLIPEKYIEKHHRLKVLV